jgi:hypothetical protein
MKTWSTLIGLYFSKIIVYINIAELMLPKSFIGGRSKLRLRVIEGL